MTNVVLEPLLSSLIKMKGCPLFIKHTAPMEIIRTFIRNVLGLRLVLTVREWWGSYFAWFLYFPPFFSNDIVPYSDISYCHNRSSLLKPAKRAASLSVAAQKQQREQLGPS